MNTFSTVLLVAVGVIGLTVYGTISAASATANALANGMTQVISAMKYVGNATISGPSVNGVFPVQVVASLANGQTAYAIQDGDYVKAVSSDGTGVYYQGPIANFDANAWNTYTIAPPGSYVLNAN